MYWFLITRGFFPRTQRLHRSLLAQDSTTEEEADKKKVTVSRLRHFLSVKARQCVVRKKGLERITNNGCLPLDVKPKGDIKVEGAGKGKKGLGGELYEGDEGNEGNEDEGDEGDEDEGDYDDDDGDEDEGDEGDEGDGGRRLSGQAPELSSIPFSQVFLSIVSDVEFVTYGDVGASSKTKFAEYKIPIKYGNSRYFSISD